MRVDRLSAAFFSLVLAAAGQAAAEPPATPVPKPESAPQHVTAPSLPGQPNKQGTVTPDGGMPMDSEGYAVTKRYDPSAPLGSRWAAAGARMFIHGIAADARGSVWGAGYEQGIIRIVGDDPTRFAAVPASVGQSIKGVAVDSDGKVWGINMTEQNATVVSPGSGLTEFTVWTDVVPGLVAPYTYSDMTGEQLRLAASLVGRYATVFEGCPEGSPEPGTTWSALTFDADVPGSTHVMFQVRTAATRAELDSAPWAIVVEVPPGASPGDIAAALTAAGRSHGRFLEVEVVLRAARTPRGVITSPAITSFSADYTCPDLPI